MASSIKIIQHDIKDCGAACLASIGNHYGVGIPIAKIRQMAHTDNPKSLMRNIFFILNCNILN